jgi:hypothetical protein
LQALYLKDAQLIAAGQKTALATAQPHALTGTHMLIVKTDDGYSVPGSVVVSAPQQVTLAEFDARVKEHGVGAAQRRRWWPNEETLVLHSLSYSAFPEQQFVDIAPPSGKRVELVGLGLKQLEVVDGWYLYEAE